MPSILKKIRGINSCNTSPLLSNTLTKYKHRTQIETTYPPKYCKKMFITLILTWALTLSCNRDMGSLLCLITTRYGSFCTAPISSWNFWREDCLITRVFAEIHKCKVRPV